MAGKERKEEKRKEKWREDGGSSEQVERERRGRRGQDGIRLQIFLKWQQSRAQHLHVREYYPNSDWAGVCPTAESSLQGIKSQCRLIYKSCGIITKVKPDWRRPILWRSIGSVTVGVVTKWQYYRVRGEDLKKKKNYKKTKMTCFCISNSSMALIYLFFFAKSHSIQDLSSQPRDRTQVSWSESVEFYQLDHQGSP